MAVSLRTRSFREAEHLAALLDAKFTHALAGAERTVADIGTIGAAPAPDLNTVLRGYLNAVLDADRADRANRDPGQPLYGETAGGGDLAAIRAARERMLRDLADHTPSAEVRLVAALLAQRHRLPEGQRGALLVGLMEANLRAAEIVERRTLGAEPVVFTEPEAPPPSAGAPVAPPSPVAPPPPVAEAAVPAKPLLSALAEKDGEEEAPFFVFRATVAGFTHQVMGQERGTLRRFREERGDRPVDRYGRGDITAFLATLRRLPKTYGKSPKDRDRSLAEIIAEADREGAERLTDKTVKRHLSTLSQFFRIRVHVR